ncbi:hypothetical protein B0181_03225 [Moraxella caviae]|uniref:Lipoprotein n=1 Tax=Moraxella caviae TaxID=34060 RepID=A0A1T0A6X3_9GAMM|nr:hypothetical protein [Moraxella caviae]OOR91329.1 hypothetical protein B0181_03225 [Moraxella caviae]STZ13938.1 Uncharacterised protein [Moraxella caviae]VEW11126.1 Uncharacterised protein [Moraxella caviae]
MKIQAMLGAVLAATLLTACGGSGVKAVDKVAEAEAAAKANAPKAEEIKFADEGTAPVAAAVATADADAETAEATAEAAPAEATVETQEAAQ